MPQRAWRLGRLTIALRKRGRERRAPTRRIREGGSPRTNPVSAAGRAVAPCARRTRARLHRARLTSRDGRSDAGRSGGAAGPLDRRQAPPGATDSLRRVVDREQETALEGGERGGQALEIGPDEQPRAVITLGAEVRRVEVEEGAGAIVARQEVGPVEVFDHHAGEPVMQPLEPGCEA